MYLLDKTLDTPAANLALDEAILDWAEATKLRHGVLRLWESPTPFVVLGRSSRVDVEVDAPACRADGIPVLRRSSGGAAVVAGPGSLMYAVIWSFDSSPEARAIDRAHRFVLDRHVAVLRQEIADVQSLGTSDLAFGVELRKFSGNSLRMKRSHFLYHGTLLYDCDLDRIARCLKTPPRQPAYRDGRAHSEFIANLPLTKSRLVSLIRSAWSADEVLETWPKKETVGLVENRYATDDWTFCF